MRKEVNLLIFSLFVITASQIPQASKTKSLLIYENDQPVTMASTVFTELNPIMHDNKYVEDDTGLHNSPSRVLTAGDCYSIL